MGLTMYRQRNSCIDVQNLTFLNVDVAYYHLLTKPIIRDVRLKIQCNIKTINILS